MFSTRLAPLTLLGLWACHSAPLDDTNPTQSLPEPLMALPSCTTPSHMRQITYLPGDNKAARSLDLFMGPRSQNDAPFCHGGISQPPNITDYTCEFNRPVAISDRYLIEHVHGHQRDGLNEIEFLVTDHLHQNSCLAVIRSQRDGHPYVGLDGASANEFQGALHCGSSETSKTLSEAQLFFDSLSRYYNFFESTQITKNLY